MTERITTRTAAISLRGLRILVPRDGAWGAGVAERIRGRGGDPLVAPLIELRPPTDATDLAEAVARWNAGEFDAVAVTSANTVEALVAHGIRPGVGSVIAAVGPATAAALWAAGLDPRVVPVSDFSALGLAEALIAELSTRAATVLLPVSDLANDSLESALTAAGHSVRRVTAYRTVVLDPAAEVRERLQAGGIDVVLVTSGSTAQALAEHCAPIPASVVLAAIGTPSAQVLRDAGLRADLVADVQTIDGLLDAVGAWAATRSSDQSSSGAEKGLEP